MLAKRQRLSSYGDTIVEVMIVLAVLGLAISISYATANRSLQNTRQAQESAEAGALAQSQMESLRSMTAPGYALGNIFQAAAYCVDSTYTVRAAAHASCNNVNGRYNITVTYTHSALLPLTVNGGKFRVEIKWPDISGQGDDTVTLVYRLYQ